MSILQGVALGLFLLFCIVMIWHIFSELKGTSRDISRGYAFANITHSAQVFEKTGVDLMGDIDYLADDTSPRKAIEKRKHKTDGNHKPDGNFHFEL